MRQLRGALAMAVGLLLLTAVGAPVRSQPTATTQKEKPPAARSASPGAPSPSPRAAPRVAPRRPAAKSPRARPKGAAISDEDLLGDLEKGVDDAPKKAAGAKPTTTGGRIQRFIQSLNPDISAIGTLCGAYFYDHGLKGKGSMVPQGGHDAGKTGFHLQEVELALQAAVDPYFRMDAYLSISMHGVHIEEAFFTSMASLAGFQFRLGHFFQRFGRFNQQHLHTWSFVDSMVPTNRLLGAEGLGNLAVEVSWLMPLPWYVNLSAALVSPSDSESFLGDGDRKSGFHIRHPGHLAYVFNLAQFWELSDNWGLSFGLSYSVGPNGSGGYDLNMTQLFGADVFLKYRNLRRPYSDIQITLEGYGRLMQVPGDSLVDWGAYGMVSFRLAKRWWLAFRYDMVEIGDSAQLQAFAFAEASTDPDHPNPLDDQHRGAVAVTFQPTHFSQFRIQYNNNWTRRMEPDGTPGKFKLSHEVFLQFTGNIGSHGAHPY